MDWMEVTLGVLADSANKSPNGKLNILGVFDTLWSAQFPAIHKGVVLVVRLECLSSEYEREKKFRIAYMGPSLLATGREEELGTIEASVVANQHDEPTSRHDLIIPLGDLVLTRAGSYAFHVQINDETKYRIPFRAIQLDEADVRKMQANESSSV